MTTSVLTRSAVTEASAPPAPRSSPIDATVDPVVIVGTGPVGMRVAQELLQRNVRSNVVLFGAEPYAPYNRVRLSSFLAGEVDWEALTRDSTLPRDERVDTRYGCAVTSIDRERSIVVDAHGREQRYSKLVLATGSRPHVPDIPNIGLPGVFTFRHLDDVQTLSARQARSHRTVVLGGGLLGLEAARAMQRFNTEVIVLEHLPRLMPRQLDQAGSDRLLAHVRHMGIQVVLGDAVRSIAGTARIEGVGLRSGTEIACDTLIVATGIRPNIEIARNAGVSVGRGIRVNDRMQTSDERIYAVGECAEHREVVYGLVAPGLEQAAVAAHCMSGGDASYVPSVTATRLKVVGLDVFSIGRVSEDENLYLTQQVCWAQAETYRKVVIEHGRLVGAMAVGKIEELGRLQEAVTHGRRIWPWEALRFRRSGALWSAHQPDDVCAWPASATVCNCTGVTQGKLTAAIGAGCASLPQLAAATGASTVCGSCRPLLAQLLGPATARTAVGWHRTVTVLALLMAPLLIALAVGPAIPYPDTVQLQWSWDALWRDSLWKQVSGYTLLGLSVFALVLSLRKRWSRLRIGGFDGWRAFHVALGVAVVAALVVHTGGRLGDELNFALSTSFVALMIVGAGAAWIIASEHRLDPGKARRLRSSLVWLHILAFWPVPLLLGFHVFKSYFY